MSIYYYVCNMSILIIKEYSITFLKILKAVEKFILGDKKPKDHWKKYRKPKK